MATTPNYDINYDDERFGKVESDKEQALTQLEQTYGGMIGSTDQYFNEQIQASKDWADKQSQIQQEQTDFIIEQVEQQKAQANKDYLKEQSGAYVDWRKQSNQYGTEAEKMASAGLANTGFSESSQVSMYNTYQNRIATARESYNRAVLNYDNAIKDAQLQNNAALAEIAYNALQKQLELSLQGFQYKNQLILEQANKKLEIDNMYYNRWRDEVNQINTENALAEDIRQYNESMAEEIRQYNENQKWQTEQKELDRQFEAKQSELTRQFQAAQAELDRKHDKAMLEAETAKQKEILKIQHQNDIAKLNQQLANEKAALKYEYDLAKQSIKVSSGSSSSSGISYTPIKSTTKAVTTTKTAKTTNTANTKPSLNITTDDAGVAILTARGISKKTAKSEMNQAMTMDEWSRRKNSGSTAPEVKNYKSYGAYLTDFVKHRLAKYGKSI
jgi:hypothetical protein